MSARAWLRCAEPLSHCNSAMRCRLRLCLQCHQVPVCAVYRHALSAVVNKCMTHLPNAPAVTSVECSSRNVLIGGIGLWPRPVTLNGFGMVTCAAASGAAIVNTREGCHSHVAATGVRPDGIVIFETPVRGCFAKACPDLMLLCDTGCPQVSLELAKAEGE